MRIILTLLAVMAGLFLSAQQFDVLLVTKTRGWHHGSVAAGVPAMKKLAEKHNFNLVRFQDGTKLNDDLLETIEVIVLLNTTGDIFDADEQAAFERFIQSGKGYVGVHAASDTEYEWEWYTKLVGRMFVIHPAVQTATLEVVENDFPGLETWPKRMIFTDEWYEFGPELSDITHLIEIDEDTYAPEADWGRVSGTGMGDNHPISWYQAYDGGRSFYTNLGHQDETFSNEMFLRHLYGGIYWAATGTGL